LTQNFQCNTVCDVLLRFTSIKLRSTVVLAIGKSFVAYVESVSREFDRSGSAFEYSTRPHA
jgi:hypothetical protein